MSRRFLLALALVCAATGSYARAQRSADFTLDQVLNYPFPENLVSAPAGNRVAWTFNERGSAQHLRRRRAGIRATQAHRLRSRRRAGAVEPGVLRRRPDDRLRARRRSRIQLAGRGQPGTRSRGKSRPARRCRSGRSPTAGGARRSCSAKGTSRRLRPKSGRVAFVRDKRIWIAPIDGSKPAEALFARGTSGSPVVVAGRPDAGVRVGSRRPQLHRALHRHGPADPLPRALHVARLDARVVAGWDEDRVRASAGQRRRAALAARPAAAVGVCGVGRSRNRHSGHEVWKSGVTPKDSYPRIAGSMDPALGGRRSPGVHVLRRRLAASVFGAPLAGGQAAAADARAVHGGARRD